ncbi:hypothetical protein BVC80_7457g1 [Macleaya cordata]|uniref:Uncharacterized protein n=1 Tax=Macleaya cordata TaxID=56857 RepID=A0A200R800_MACCD|nr:hypothetical protein BVC80_7457g1 [Macleaya cordata]
MEGIATKFSTVYRVSRKKKAFVHEVMQFVEEGRVEWDLDLPRRLGDVEALEFSQLIALLQSYKLQDGKDKRFWRWEKSGICWGLCPKII